MPFRVFETDQEGANLLQQDELVNRQTIVVKDGEAWEIDGKVVLVDGSEEALEQAEELILDHGGQVSEQGEEIKADIDAEEGDAAAGIGAIFG